MASTPSSGFSSPVIQKNTPIKRIGLSRKRKSCKSDNNITSKVQALGNESSNNSIPTFKKQVTENSAENQNYDIVTQSQKNEKTLSFVSVISEDEMNSIKQKISEKENELKSLKLKRNIESLENLIEVWKAGCKNAYLYLIELLKEKYSGEIDSKTVLNKLGIFKTMSETFENDSEVSLSDSSQ